MRWVYVESLTDEEAQAVEASEIEASIQAALERIMVRAVENFGNTAAIDSVSLTVGGGKTFVIALTHGTEIGFRPLGT